MNICGKYIMFSYFKSKQLFKEYRNSVMKKKIGDFKLGKTIGNGTFGSVREATHLPTGEKVAIKILQKKKIKEPKDLVRIERQITLLKKIKHQKIVQLLDLQQTDKAIYLITQLVQGQELYHHIVNNSQLQQQQSANYFWQILQAVQYLHQHKICHRDLKPQNIILNKGNIKIIDFGLSKEINNEKNLLTTSCGSPCYAAPEMLKGNKYNGYKTDVWALGVTLYAMICGKLPFENSKTAKLYKLIASGKYEQPVQTSNQLKDLLSKLLQVDPQKRYQISNIKTHQWFQKFKPRFKVQKILQQWNFPLLKTMQYIFNLTTEKLQQVISSRSQAAIFVYYFLLKNKAQQSKSEQKNPQQIHDGPIHLDYIFRDVQDVQQWVDSNLKSGKLVEDSKIELQNTYVEVKRIIKNNDLLYLRVPFFLRLEQH